MNCLMIMIVSKINPFAFRSPNGSTSLINTWLVGKTLSLRFLNEHTELRFARLIFYMGGVLQFHDHVDYIVSPTFFAPSHLKATVVRPEWLDRLQNENLVSAEPTHQEVLYEWENRRWTTCLAAQHDVDIAKIVHGATRTRQNQEETTRDRMLAVQTRLRNGETARSISADLHMSLRDVQAAKNAIDNPEGLSKLRPRGRPSKASPEVVHEIHAATTENPYLGARALARMIQIDMNSTISRQTVNTIRNFLRFRYSKARKCPLITKLQQEKRKKFAEECRNGSIDWTRQVIISDESRFGLYDDSRSMWVQRGVYTERTTRPVPKHDSSIMVWGAIGWNYKSQLIIVQGTLNALRYQDMLGSNNVIEGILHQFGRRNVWFQQDGAPAHRAKSTMKWLARLIRVILNWPPNSPDLSVIENV
jgi:transposase